LIQLVMVGTGSAFAKAYYNNSALVMTENYTLLIDCGATTPLGLHTFDQAAMGRIDGVIISHIHGDHVNGLEELAFQMMYKYKKKIDLFLPDTLYGPLWETLRGGLELTTEGKMTIHNYFNVKLISSSQPCRTYKITEDLTIRPVWTKHIPYKNSFGFIINEEVFYSADTVLMPDLLASVNKTCHTIFHDCQLFSYPGQVHASLDELIGLPKEIREKMILMHYGDEVGEEHYKKAQDAGMNFAVQGHLYELKL
jgi:ribonuclease BN (tRNA processing enzyme)